MCMCVGVGGLTLTEEGMLDPYLGTFYILCCLVCREMAITVSHHNSRENNFKKCFLFFPIINQG